MRMQQGREGGVKEDGAEADQRSTHNSNTCARTTQGALAERAQTRVLRNMLGLRSVGAQARVNQQ